MTAITSGVLIALILRYDVLENEAQAVLCNVGRGELICSLRAALGWSIHYQLFGLGGLVTAVLSWLPRLQLLVLPGLFFSAAAMALYNTTLGAIGLIVALLAALR